MDNTSADSPDPETASSSDPVVTPASAPDPNPMPAEPPVPAEELKIHDMTNGKPPKNHKPLLIIVGVIVLAVIGFAVFLFMKTNKAAAPAADQPVTGTVTVSISTYEECIKQDKAIIEQTYPARCVYGGKTYVQQVEEKPAVETKKDPMADWKTFKAKSDSFSVKYPGNYLTRDCSTDGNASYFGPSEALLAICNSGKTGQIYFGAAPKAEFTMASLKRAVNAAYEKDYKYEDITVNGKAMIKTTSTLKGGEMTEDGTKTVTYDYVSGDTHFAAVYQRQPSEPDDLATFEQMITTWTIK